MQPSATGTITFTNNIEDYVFIYVSIYTGSVCLTAEAIFGEELVNTYRVFYTDLSNMYWLDLVKSADKKLYWAAQMPTGMTFTFKVWAYYHFRN